MLEAKGRITLSVNCHDWVNAALGAPGVSWVPLDPGILIESSRLPGAFHGDPADRMIVATARKLDATVVTRDQGILAYGESGYVKVLQGK